MRKTPGYYRIIQPLDALGLRGHQTAYGTRITPEWVRQAEVIVGQRVCLPGPSALWQKLSKQGRTLVYEVDDDLLGVHPSNTAAYRLYNRPEIRQNLIANARAASRVTVSTEPLAEVMRLFHDDVRVVPNAVPDWLLSHERPRNDRLTIGWGGSPTHQMDFDEVRGPLRQFLRRNPKVRFHCLGADYATGLKLPKGQADVTPWVPSVDGYLTAIDFDIAIAPLRPHRFNRAKSALKALEAAALGIPIVASAVYPYEHFVRHGETGFLVRRDHEWSKYLRELVGDEAMRLEMGRKARELASAHTVSVRAGEWEEALDAVLV